MHYNLHYSTRSGSCVPDMGYVSIVKLPQIAQTVLLSLSLAVPSTGLATTLTGFVFRDANPTNGVFDSATETKVGGYSLKFQVGNNPVATVKTATDGNFSFEFDSTSQPTLTVTNVNSPGWGQTSYTNNGTPEAGVYTFTVIDYSRELTIGLAKSNTPIQPPPPTVPNIRAFNERVSDSLSRCSNYQQKFTCSLPPSSPVGYTLESCNWDFGDNTLGEGVLDPVERTMIVNHIYQNAGYYFPTVAAVIVDQDGTRHYQTTEIEIDIPYIDETSPSGVTFDVGTAYDCFCSSSRAKYLSTSEGRIVYVADPPAYDETTSPGEVEQYLMREDDTVYISHTVSIDALNAMNNGAGIGNNGICIGTNGVLTDSSNGSDLKVSDINATVKPTFIFNRGRISVESAQHRVSAASPAALQGANVDMTAQYFIANEGIIKAGRGGDHIAHQFNDATVAGQKGGDIILQSQLVSNRGNIGSEQAIGYNNGNLVTDGGNGGVGSRSSYVRRTQDAPSNDCNNWLNNTNEFNLLPNGSTGGNSSGGKGGSISVSGWEIENWGVIKSGYGGDARAYECSWGNRGYPGAGGDMNITPEVAFRGNGTLDGSGGRVLLEPVTISGNKGFRIANASEIMIFGGNNSKIVLNNIDADAISAVGDIILAVGAGGTIDLRNNTAQIFKSTQGKVKIYADKVLLDSNVSLQQLANVTVEQNPAKILYAVTLTGSTGLLKGEAGQTVPVTVKVRNSGPTTDTYALSATDANGSAIADLPSTITVDGLQTKTITFNLTLPSAGQVSNIVVTATSQADATATANTSIQAFVPQKPLDTDNDGISDEEDTDDDNDGYSDVAENTANTNPTDPNSYPFEIILNPGDTGVPGSGGSRLDIAAKITADDIYSLYHGNSTKITNVGHDTLWTGAEVYNFSAMSTDFIYIAAVNVKEQQGVLAEFLAKDRLVTTGGSEWQVYFTDVPVTELSLDTATVLSQIQRADEGNKWQGTVVGGANGVSPWGTIAGISNSTKWMWKNVGTCSLNATFDGCSEVDNRLLIFRLPVAALTVKPKVDLWVADPAPDDGTEPSKTTWIWASPDVWVRNQDDNGTQYQNPIYGQDNFVYVNVKNRGTLPATNTKVEVYRSGASMGRGWPVGWDLVGTTTIDELEAGKNTTVRVKWDKDRMATPGHYCFYVRVLNDEDPMFSAETNDLVGNTFKNNNIAWRNFDVVGMLRQVTNNFQVNLGNPNPTPATISVVFDEKENLLQNDGSKVIVTLGADLFKRWQDAGAQGENIRVLNGTDVQLLATPAKLIGVQLAANEQDVPITMQVDAFKPAPGEGTERHYHFSTQEVDSDGKVIGGVDYDIITRAQDTDSDGDGVKDVIDNDNDNDGIDDDLEIKNGLNPLGSEDAEGDLDGDGQTNREEINAGSDPSDPKSKVAYYTPHGTLKDAAGNPLAGVTVQVGNKTVTTDAAGNWKVEGLTEGDYTVKGALENFTCLADVALGNEMYQQEVVCKQISSLKVTAKSTPFNAMYQGGKLSYLITATNGSDKTATGVVINNLNLPQGVEVLSLKALDGGECDVTSVSCALPDLTPGSSARVQLELGNVAAGQFHHNIALNATGFPTDQIATWKTVKPYLSTSVACTPNPVVMLSELHCTATAELSSFAPEPTATGLKLQFTPSKGTELKAATTNHGQCDIQDGKAICAINDLSIVDATQISKAAVELDLKLVDAGLLVLTSEAKLTAENYAEHSAKSRTNIMIPKDFKAGLVLAIDTTYSMNKFINGVIKGLEQFIENALKDPVTAPLTVLIEFKDDVRIVTPPTRDLNAVLTALRGLKVGGGGTCPEASVEAFNLGADYLTDNGVISIVTNAPPYPDANVDALKQRVTDMTGKGAKVFILYEPECEVTSETNQDLNGVGTDSLPTTP